MSKLQVVLISLLIVVSAAGGLQGSRRTFAEWKALRGLSARNSVRNAPWECQKPIDIGIVMDISSRNTATGYNDIMTFVRTLVSYFDISIDMAHVGAISFDYTAKVLLKFDEAFDQITSLKDVLLRMNDWREGVPAEKTTIKQAMELAASDLFGDYGGARGYDEVLVVLTYARQNLTAAAQVARKLEERGVKIIVVGVDLFDPIELWEIAGAIEDPSKGDNVFYMQHRSTVKSEAHGAAQTICRMFEDVHV